jgi:hypothetical protein
MMKMFKGAPVKGAIIHGVLLLVMLVYGYKVWTKEKSTETVTAGSIVLWNKPESDLVAIEYASPTRTVKLERRGEGANGYWWGIETKETPPPPTPPATHPGPLSPGDGSGAAPTKPGTPPAIKPGTPPAIKPGTPPAIRPGTPPARPGAGSAAPTTPKPATTPPKPATTTPKPTTPKPATTPPAAGSAAPAPGPAKSPDEDGERVLIARGPGDGSGTAGSAGAGSSAGSAGSGGGSASGPAGGPIDDPLGQSVNPDAPRPVSTTREFPVGESADKVIKGLTNARALRDLGKLTDALKEEYKLEDTSITLSVVMKSGTRSFVIGGSVYGGRDKYVLDTDSGKGYVLSGDLLSPFEQGESGLRLTDPRGFPADQIQKVTVSVAATNKARSAVRMLSAAPAKPDPGDPHAPPTGKTKTWGDPATGKPDQTLANFIDNAERLKPTKYEASLDPAAMTEVVKLAYQDAKGGTLGTVTLYKRDKPAEGAAPAVTEYYVMTEKSRVPGFVPKGAAERIDQDVATVFPQ